MNPHRRSPIRIISYLVPDISIEYFEFIAHFLEDVLKVDTVLCYESRFSGPKKGNLDVFESNIADIGKVKLVLIVQLMIPLLSLFSFYLWYCISAVTQRE